MSHKQSIRQGRRKRDGLGRLTFLAIQQGTTRTLLRCTGGVELLCLSSETRSRSVLGLRGRNQSHPFFSARTLSYVSESVDTLYISLVPRPSPSEKPRPVRIINTYGACARGGGRRPGYEATLYNVRPPHPPCPSYGPVRGVLLTAGMQCNGDTPVHVYRASLAEPRLLNHAFPPAKAWLREANTVRAYAARAFSPATK